MLDVLSPLSSVPWVFVDTETTGLVSSKHRIWEICAIRYELRNGEPFGWQLSNLVNPAVQIDEDYHFRRPEGVTGADLRAAHPWSTWSRRFAEICQGALFFAHNAPFDVRFLEAEQGYLREPTPIEGVVCTHQLAKKLLPHLKSHSLESLVSALGIEPKGQLHRAQTDALAMKELFEKHLLPLLGEVQVHELIRYTGMEKHSPALGAL